MTEATVQVININVVVISGTHSADYNFIVDFHSMLLHKRNMSSMEEVVNL